MEYVLASSSPRRQELLKLITKDFHCVSPAIDETAPANTEPVEIPCYLAEKKARKVAGDFPGACVIGCDTAVILEGCIFGKPANEKQAKQVLQQLSGKVHTVVTGCCMISHGNAKTFSETTQVEFYPLSNRDICAYIQTGEPFDKAGAYGIQGYGALFVKKINGDFYNVVGFPVARIKRELQNLEEHEWNH